MIFTFTFPALFSFFFCLPFDLTSRFTVPAAVGVFVCLTTPLPVSVRVPGPGTVTGSLAVPFFLFSFGLPRVIAFDGGVA